MAKLILFRHAKAAPAAPGQSDFDRPLTDRGRRDAARMGATLSGRPIDLALVSAAQRTRETYEVATAALEPRPRADITRDLYLCGAGKLIRRVAAMPSEIKELMVIGHNPDLHEIALWLAGNSGSEASIALRAKFPTAAMAEFTLDLASWKDLDPSRASLVRFATPADFEG